jgi:hypothetical protein
MGCLSFRKSISAVDVLLQADKALLFLDKESPQDNGGAV